MLAVLIALLLIAVSVAGIYWLLKSMGEDGVEAAAPGSCKSGRCGVQPRQPGAGHLPETEVQYMHTDEIKRLDGDSNKQVN